MGKLESKSISVAPEQEQEAISKHEMFGWQLLSSNEVYNKDSRLETRGDEIWNVTTTTNYVKLVFQRDAEMPNIEQIKSLEKDYWHFYKIAAHCPSSPSWKFRILLPIVCALPGIFSSNFVLMLVGLVLGIAVVIGHKKLIYQPKVKQWADWANKRDELEEQIKALIANN